MCREARPSRPRDEGLQSLLAWMEGELSPAVLCSSTVSGSYQSLP